MKIRGKQVFLTAAVVVLVLLANLGPAMAGDYPALEGMKSVQAIFDFRNGDPASALALLTLIHETYKDQALRQISAQPKFVLSFIGKSVKLITSDRAGVAAGQGKTLDKIAARLDLMAKDGMRLEVCMAAVRAFKVKPAMLLPIISQVPNGWISLIAYQAHDYALVPVY